MAQATELPQSLIASINEGATEQWEYAQANQTEAHKAKAAEMYE